MILLKVKPLTRDPDDGVAATYECGACLTTSVQRKDAYATPEYVRCPLCQHFEGDNGC